MLIYQAHHCGAFIQKHSSIVTIFLSLTPLFLVCCLVFSVWQEHTHIRQDAVGDEAIALLVAKTRGKGSHGSERGSQADSGPVGLKVPSVGHYADLHVLRLWTSVEVFSELPDLVPEYVVFLQVW